MFALVSWHVDVHLSNVSEA